MKETHRGERISKIKRIGEAAVIGATLGGGREYLRQRGELKKEIPLEQKTIKGWVGREVTIYQKVDKAKVGKEAVKGALGEATIEGFRRKPRQPAVLPLAA